MLELGVDTVICGGIDRWSVESLRSEGVTIYGWVTGEVEDAVESLLSGELDSEATVQAGGRCRCRRFVPDEMTGTQPQAPGRGMRGRGRGHRNRGGGRRGAPTAQGITENQQETFSAAQPQQENH